MNVEKACKCGRLLDGGKRICKECRKAVDKGFYQRHTPKLIQTKSQRKRDILDWYRSLKTNKPCYDCGNSFHFAAMDFDHRDGVIKKDDISHMVRTGRAKEVVLEEVQKCVLLCSNCHRLRTFNRVKGKEYAY